MNTPICDFVNRYADTNILRLHMPGHKGVGTLGVEARDITEIQGADSLFDADGIILESERNASTVFGCPTYYSTEGSSLCIRAMLYLARLDAKQHGKDPLILAGRNAHKTFLSAVALLDVAVEWIDSTTESSYLSCKLTPKQLETRLACANQRPTALYLTSPDYLGNVADLSAISAICRRYGVLLLVDNAHGAYLKFLSPSHHPIDLGADLVCDSAHKTLPVLTGGAYLHVGNSVADRFSVHAVKNAMSLFASTSPSYLILQSLDAANPMLADSFGTQLVKTTPYITAVRKELTAGGWSVCGDEPMKLTLLTKPYGYRGDTVAAHLRTNGIECEFCDPDHIVFMFTPQIGAKGIRALRDTLLALSQRHAITELPPARTPKRRRISPREALLSPFERLPIGDCVGRVLASTGVSCPPAVPIVLPGEEIDEDALLAFAYYGITHCDVVK